MKKCSEFFPDDFFEEYLCFSNIMTRNVRFYEDGTADENREFCKDKNLTYLPSRDGKLRYSLDGDRSTFKKEDITSEYNVTADEVIFSTEIRDKFKKNDILFVYKEEKIVGVVHYSDYNSLIVYLYLYSKIMIFEETLRKYFDAKGVSNQDVIDYFTDKIKTCNHKETDYFCSRITYFKKQEEKMRELKPFQIFAITDLIRYANSQFKLEIGNKKISDLRNNIMHFRILVRYDTNDDSEFIYDYKTFEELLENMRYLDKQQEILEQQIKEFR